MTSQKEQLSYLLKSDKDLEELISSIPKIVPFKREKGFEGLVRLICEQQLSVASAKAIFDRLAKIVSPFEAKNFLKVSKKDLQKTGLSRQPLDRIYQQQHSAVTGSSHHPRGDGDFPVCGNHQGIFRHWLASRGNGLFDIGDGSNHCHFTADIANYFHQYYAIYAL